MSGDATDVWDVPVRQPSNPLLHPRFDWELAPFDWGLVTWKPTIAKAIVVEEGPTLAGLPPLPVWNEPVSPDVQDASSVSPSTLEELPPIPAIQPMPDATPHNFSEAMWLFVALSAAWLVRKLVRKR